MEIKRGAMNNLEERIARLESRIKRMNESEDFSEKEKVFTYLCKSCNLTDVSFRGKIATCKFDMSTFYRRIMRRMHLKYKDALKAQIGKECRIVCNMETQEWEIRVGDEVEPLSRNVVPQPGDSIALTRDNRRIILSCIGYALERIIDRMNESVDRESRWKFNKPKKEISEADLERRITKLESLVLEEDDDEEGVIRKVGNKWRILKKNRKDYWDAEYDTKEDAQAALRAYWANKHECKNQKSHIVIEGFSSEVGKDLIRNVQSFLIKIFGHTLYFDHYTDKSVDLYYKGKEIAELLYNDKSEEVVIMPDDTDVAPVAFYDTSETEIQDYLSDLILGDLSPSY